MPIPEIAFDDKVDAENLIGWLVELDLFHKINASFPDKNRATEYKALVEKFHEQLAGKSKSLAVWLAIYELQALLSIFLKDTKQAEFYILEALDIMPRGQAMEFITSRKAFRSPLLLEFLENRVKEAGEAGWTEEQINEYFHFK